MALNQQLHAEGRGGTAPLSLGDDDDEALRLCAA
eukprot:CAMPEP_0117678706 /NCGR_PEP_ID=MMETSP0804-20121206/17438_1 /TAXON_ID=1074897 /ORGANISM="Tetraselmis astigmatica, Strain CCMP880" /LENGTH=33 /DNA_ID= /DNA_START= /DNA_END= /DNA_ORIENTATION=